MLLVICVMIVWWLIQLLSKKSHTIDDVSNSDNVLPKWMNYIVQQGYFTTDEYQRLKSKNLSRAQITPYLAHYGQLKGLDMDTTRECQFSDINDDDMFSTTIIQACQYGLMKWFGKRFLPDRTIKRYELISALIRSQVGIIDQSSDPWYLPYLQKAIQYGIISEKISLDQIRWDVIIDDIGHIIYQLDNR